MDHRKNLSPVEIMAGAIIIMAIIIFAWLLMDDNDANENTSLTPTPTQEQQPTPTPTAVMEPQPTQLPTPTGLEGIDAYIQENTSGDLGELIHGPGDAYVLYSVFVPETEGSVNEAPEDTYEWYVFDTETQESTKISGIPVTQDAEASVLYEGYGWYDATTVVASSGTALETTGYVLYDVTTQEITPIPADEDYREYLI